MKTLNKVVLVLGGCFFFASLLIYLFQLNAELALLFNLVGVLFLGVFAVLSKGNISSNIILYSAYICIVLSFLSLVFRYVF
ncbi:hypothetical protein [Staphylococcus succinus]|uniref:DUF3953 domain-containing protein n=1 Tax=Staphylococcus succinus TaxID=61015 RepID=A0A9Q6HM53_9STAP|nr:hypothetical protein [Staphylococcus succinus]PTI73573.1 hypothetical protein BU058_13060 [Staphylococcus succinus]